MANTLKDPARINLVIVQGSRFVQGFAWSQDGVRVQLDGYQARAEIRTEINGRLVANLTPYLTIDIATDAINLDIPASATAKIDRDGVWDLFLVNPLDAADAVKLAAGRVTSHLAVTRQ